MQVLPGKDGLVKETLLLSVDSDKFKPGSSYVLQAFCTDFGPAGHVGKSDPLVLRVRSLEELTIADDDPAGSAFEELDKAIAAQQAALSVSKNLSANIEDVFSADGTKTKIAQSLKNHQDRLKDKQHRVGKHLTNAWDVSPEPRPSFVEKMVAIRDGAHRQVTAKMNDGVFGGRVGMSGVASHLRSVENLQAHILEQLIALKGVVAAASRSEAEKEAADILGEEEEMYEMTTEEILEKTARELDEFAKALDACVDRVRYASPHARVTVATPLPDPARPRIGAAFADEVRRIAEEHHARLLDVHALVTATSDWKELYEEGGVYSPYPLRVMDEIIQMVSEELF